MYGLVNKAVEDLVVSGHGEEVWARIRAQAGATDIAFISMDPYPDELTFRLVGAASEVLEIPVGELLHAFGRHWMLFTAREGYAELLDASGSSFFDFVANLDGLHTRLGLAFRELRPPSFVCHQLDERTARLEYYSERAGLQPMVVGLLQGLGERFGHEIEVELVEPRGADDECDVFEVRIV